MGSKNGNGARAKALALGPQYGPADLVILLDARTEVLLGLATTDVERSIVNETLARGWEERPATSKVVGMLERRAENGDDREILRRAGPFRRLLPEAQPEPAPDPVLEQLILECTARKVQAEAVANVKLDAVVAAHIALRKAKTPADIERIQEKGRAAANERDDARQALDREMSRLTYLLQQRTNRRRALLLAESVRP